MHMGRLQERMQEIKVEHLFRATVNEEGLARRIGIPLIDLTILE